MKTCYRCKEVKPLEEFSKHKRNKDGLQSGCKDCMKSMTKDWKSKNDHQYKAYAKAYKERNPEKYSKWFEENKEHIAGYRHRTKERRAANENNRRARQRKATVGYLPSGYYELVMKYYKRCLKCGSVQQPSLDHITPLVKGGTHTLLNLQRLCGPCNSSKNAHHSTDYRTGPVLAWFVPPMTADLNNFERQYVALK